MGASVRDLYGLVLREGAVLAAAGLATGVMGTFATGRWLAALVYGVSARDPLSYGLAVLLLPAAALLGCWRPARRASTANAADLIREE